MQAKEPLTRRRALAMGTVAGAVALDAAPARAQSIVPADDRYALRDRWPRNVKDYGATGNGTTDDTAAVQAAIDAAAAAGGGAVYVPAGTYRIGTVNLKSRITLFGDGWASVLKFRDTGGRLQNAGYLGNGSNVDTGITVRDLEIDGNRAALGNGNHHGVLLANATGVTLERLHVTSCHRIGICLGGDSSAANGAVTRGVVQACHVTDIAGVDGGGSPFGVGIAVIRGEDVVIGDCFLSGNSTHGIDVEPNQATSVCRNITIRGVHASDNGESGISLYNATASQDTDVAAHVRVAGCRSHDNGQSGIRVFGYGYVVVQDCHGWGNDTDGIAVENYNSGLRVRDCILRQNAGSGIRFHNQAQPIALVQGNTLRGNGRYGVENSLRTTFWLDLLDNHMIGNALGGSLLTAPAANGRIRQSGNEAM